jgi:hypothetical protein
VRGGGDLNNDGEYRIFGGKVIKIGATVLGAQISSVWLEHHTALSAYLRFAVSVVVGAFAFGLAEMVLKRWHLAERD